MDYRRLESGIVIRINHLTGECDFPYGPKMHAPPKWATMPVAFRNEFEMQRTLAWARIADLYVLLGRLDDDAYDAGLAALGYASLTFDDSRQIALLTYAQSVLRYVLRAERDSQHDGLQAHAELACARSEKLIGQIGAQFDINKYRSALNKEQWQILLARFDSELSYDEIAREFGYASRTTAFNKVAEALAICRKLPYH